MSSENDDPGKPNLDPAQTSNGKTPKTAVIVKMSGCDAEIEAVIKIPERIRINSTTLKEASLKLFPEKAEEYQLNVAPEEMDSLRHAIQVLKRLESGIENIIQPIVDELFRGNDTSIIETPDFAMLKKDFTRILAQALQDYLKGK